MGTSAVVTVGGEGVDLSWPGIKPRYLARGAAAVASGRDRDRAGYNVGATFYQGASALYSRDRGLALTG